MLYTLFKRIKTSKKNFLRNTELIVGNKKPEASPTKTRIKSPERWVHLGAGGSRKVPTVASENSTQVAGCPQSGVQAAVRTPPPKAPPLFSTGPPLEHPGPPGDEGIIPGRVESASGPWTPSPAGLPCAPGRVFPDDPSKGGL